ncbi:MAG TPA: outer membrane protein transport protein [Pseudolabrys sp.]
MSYRRVKSLLLACSGVGALLTATVDANAGGFALREQSAYGQGSSFAGVAAGGSLSSMFWNPATITQVPGIQTEMVLTGIMPYSSHTVTSGTFAAFGGAGDSGNDALVPAGYASWQINPQTWLGLAVNSPVGLSVSFPDRFAGRTLAADTNLKTYNATPSIAYQLNNWISVGAGVQIQYAKADLSTGLPINGLGVVTGGLGNQLNISGDGWGYGFTAGVTLTPTPTTTVGIGYRSAIDQKISGTLSLPAGPVFSAPFSTPGAVDTTLNLPDTVTLGLRQRLTQQWMLMATVEWSDWSRIGTSNVLQSSGAPATVARQAVTLPFQYSDGWFYSLGAEYQWNPQLALRAGVGFEKSPITDQVRTPRLPDNDRTWLSLGATYQWTRSLSFDFAYSHLFVKNTPINISADSGNPWFSGVSYVGSVSSHADIVSLALKYRWDDPAPAPMQQRYSK